MHMCDLSDRVLLLCQPGLKTSQSTPPRSLTGHLVFKRSFMISHPKKQNTKTVHFIFLLAFDVDFELDVVPVPGSSRFSDIFLQNHNHVW